MVLPRFGSMAMFFRNHELLPLMGILGFAGGICAAFCGYSLYQKPDVKVNKTLANEPYQRIGEDQQQKILNFNMKYKFDPQLDALRREIGDK